MKEETTSFNFIKKIEQYIDGEINEVNLYNFGSCVSTVGDVNGDGYSDVIIGEYGYSNFKGRASIFYGATIMDTLADVIFTGLINNTRLGQNSLSTIGDVNGDGYSDVLVADGGYADGYPRRLGNGVGKVWVNGKFAPIIGTICMDMFMIDITDIENIKEGDDVIIFGIQLPVQQVAKWANTIPYEIMTGISQRVKRVYFEE